MSIFFRKLNWLRQRATKEAELEEELRFHLEEEGDELRGRRDLGNITMLKEDTRAAWTWTPLEQLFQDLRYAVRTMRANKSFMLLAALSLALGIGANTAIYSVMDAILLRSLPVQDPSSLVRMIWVMRDVPHKVVHDFHGHGFDEPGARMSSGSFPYGAYELFRGNGALFDSLFAYDPIGSINLVVNGQAEIVAGEYVSGDYFRGLGVPPAAGRLISADDDHEGAPPVAVLSWGFCQKYFGGAANASGQSILVNNVAFTVAGVTPQEFFGVDPSASPDIYLPLRLNMLAEGINSFGAKKSRYLDKNAYWLQIMARLRPGVSRLQMENALRPQFHNWVAATAANDDERANLPELLVKNGSGGFDILRQRFSKPLLVLWTLVGLILAIACANIANLQLARASARRREIALRVSVGASRWRVVRQLLTESVLLSSVGGALGLFIAVWGERFLTVALATSGKTEMIVRAGLNWRVLAMAACFSVVTGILFGLAPALQSTRLDVIGALKEARAGSRRSWHGASARQVLVVSQIAMSLVILFAAGLFVRNLSNLHSVDLGFNRENVLLFELNARRSGHTDAGIAGFYQDLAKRFAAIPGVRGVSLSNTPLIGEGQWGTGVLVARKPVDSRFVMIGSGFFSTMQIPLLSGREIDDRDRPGAVSAAVVNARFASLYFPGVNPLGQHITFGGGPVTPHDVEIVGVSKNTSYGDVDEAVLPTVFIPYTQNLWPVDEMTYELRTAGDPLVYTSSIREIVHQADRLLPVAKIRTQSKEIDNNLTAAITFARLCSLFAVLALAIACMGLYGAMSYNIARRTSEIGIRMAVGAPRRTVVWMILRSVMLLTGVGLLVSIPAALAASQVVKSVLFQMQPNDPLALTGAVVILIAAIFIAGYVPARKASLIDPMVALRHE